VRGQQRNEGTKIRERERETRGRERKSGGDGAIKELMKNLWV